MKNEEFLKIYHELYVGKEVKIRYFTYNENDYIDVIGKISSFYGVDMLQQELQKGSDTIGVVNGNIFYFCIEYFGTYKYHDNFKEKNIPKLSLFDVAGQVYCNMLSNQIIFIKPASIRAFKIHQIKNRID